MNEEMNEILTEMAAADEPHSEPATEATEPTVSKETLKELYSISAEEVLSEEISNIKKIQMLANAFPNELAKAIAENRIVSYEEGYYTYPAIDTKFGKITFGLNSGDNAIPIDYDWLVMFYKFWKVRNKEMDFLESLKTVVNSSIYAEFTKKINESDFFNESDPFEIRRPLNENVFNASIAFDVSDPIQKYISDRHLMVTVFELSKRYMTTEADNYYLSSIFSNIDFVSEPVDKVDGIAPSIMKRLEVRKVKSATGKEFYTVTGDIKDMLKLSIRFTSAISDNSPSFQGSYRKVAEAFLKNGWWSNALEEMDIKNPEKIFLTLVPKYIDQELVNKSLLHLAEIRKTIIPEGSVLVLRSPFTFAESKTDERDFTYLYDFLTPKALAPDVTLDILNCEETVKNDLGPISDIVPCGLLTDERMFTTRNVLDNPELPEKVTMILKDLSIK